LLIFPHQTCSGQDPLQEVPLALTTHSPSQPFSTTLFCPQSAVCPYQQQQQQQAS